MSKRQVTIESALERARRHDEAGRYDKSAGICQNILSLNPNHVGALNYLAYLYRKQGRNRKALAYYNQVVGLRPDSAMAHYNLANTYFALRKLDVAVKHYQRALKIDPEFSAAYSNLGCLFAVRGRNEAALRCHQRAIELSPDDSKNYNNLANALYGLGEVERARENYQQALEKDPGFSQAHSNLIACLNYSPAFTQEQIFAESRRWDVQHGLTRSSEAIESRSVPRGDQKIRVGYVSPDFRRHSVAYFVEPVIRDHDRERFEVFCYGNVEHTDSTTRRIAGAADHWRPIFGLTDEDVVALIKRDGIDILVDLAGHTSNNRLGVFTLRPAPIQMTWLGYPNTTGLEAMDFRITDGVADPAGVADSLYTETLIRLDKGFLYYEAPEFVAGIHLGTPPCRNRGFLTFGSFNNALKTTPEVVTTWAEIMRAVPNSRIVLKSKHFTGAYLARRYRSLFEKQGIDPARIDFLSWEKTMEAHIRRYREIDIALDTFPYNGTTTTFEALWMGVPVVTFPGDRHAARVGASILTHAGLSGLLGKNIEAYKQLAIDLANDWQRLDSLRSGVRSAMSQSNLRNVRDFVHQIESVYESVFKVTVERGNRESSDEKVRRGESIVGTVRTLLKQKKFAEAENRCEEIFRLTPDDPAANHAKGLVIAVGGKPSEAVSFLESAVKSKPDLIEAHNDLGLILLSLGRLDEAETALEKAIEIDSSSPSPRINLADLRKKQNRLNEAIDEYQKALELNPNNASVYKKLGATLRDVKEPRKAVTAFGKYLEIAPDDTEVMTSRAHAMKESGEIKAAIEGYLKVIKKDPERVSALNGFAVSLQQSGHLELAIANYRKILEIYGKKTPENGDKKRVRSESTVRCNLAVALRRTGRVSDARDMYESALKLNPANIPAWNNLGNTNKELGRNEEAAKCFRRALELDPKNNSAHSNLLFALNYYADQETIYKESVAWEAMHGSVARIRKDQDQSQKAMSRRKIRVGYLSEDFKRHSVAFFLLPLLENHDRSGFEIYCYSDVARRDAYTEKFRSIAHGWLNVTGMSAEKIAHAVAKDEIDILVDLGGHTASNLLKVFPYRAAPVQVSWLGYPNTTGLSCIDYRLTDDVADPAVEKGAFHTESLIYLREGFLCYRGDPSVSPASTPPVDQKGFATFGSFNNLPKVTPRVIALWSKVLLSVPESKILLKSLQLRDEAIQERIRETFERNGVSSDRIELYGRTPNPEDHLKFYDNVDIALDSFPYNGTTTTFEALWMGVPVIALRGVRHADRVGASILTHAGLESLIAETESQYVDLARSLASDTSQLRCFRQTLRSVLKDSSLCDERGFAAKIESVFENMMTQAIDPPPHAKTIG